MSNEINDVTGEGWAERIACSNKTNFITESIEPYS